MDGFSINKIILGLHNPEFYLKKLKETEQGQKIDSFAPQLNSSLSNNKPQINQMINSLQNLAQSTELLQMNHLNNIDRSAYIKTLLGLPPTLGEILMNAQNIGKPLVGGTLGMTNINPELLQNQKVLNELFNDKTNGLINPDLIMQNQVQNTKPQQDAVMLLFSGMISMSDISKLILQNSKQAIAGLIISMASASKNGMNSEQIQETLSVLNSCISMAESDNPAQTLKSLMMLYLPWLPLNEGVGFDLEITQEAGETESNNSKLTVLIQTKNYGNIKGVFTLTTTNSVEVYIICNESFPKKVLLKSLQDESTAHSMNTVIDIEAVKPIKEEKNTVQETKVNLSATNEMNPYLLLMAHSFIRNTILIDSNTSLNAA